MTANIIVSKNPQEIKPEYNSKVLRRYNLAHVLPVCASCGSSAAMVYQGAIKNAHGQMLIGFECQHDWCKRHHSWQTVEVTQAVNS